MSSRDDRKESGQESGSEHALVLELRDIHLRIADVTEESRLIEMLQGDLLRLLRADGVRLLVTENGNVLAPEACPPRLRLPIIALRDGSNDLESLLLEQKTRSVPDLDGLKPRLSPALGLDEFRSALVVPFSGKTGLATLQIFWREKREIEPEAAALAEILADYYARAANNLRLLQTFKARERQFREVVDAQDALIVRWKPGGIRTFVNEAYRRTFGAVTEELVGTSFFPLVSEEHRAEVEKRMARLTPENPVVSGIHKVVVEGGYDTWQEWTDRAIFDSENRLIEYQSVGRDITERVIMEEQLSRARTEEVVANLAIGIVHDMNNLLVPIIGNLDLLRLDLEEDEGAQELLGQVDEPVQAIRDLLTQLLRFGRDQRSQRSGSVLETVDLEDCIESLWSILGSVVGPKVELEVLAEAELPPVRANRSLIGQIIVNLAANARDAQPSGGRFSIALETTRIENGDFLRGDFVCLRCRDDGPGMAPEVLARVFDRYFTTKGAKGTGLGLATVQSICRELGGDARIRSAPGEGTVVDIFLPAVADELPAKSAPRT